MKPTLAALIPYYNDSEHLETTLQGIVKQTVPFDEIIIIDDGSTATDASYLEKFTKDIPRARVYRNEQNLGVVATLNRGFNLVTSDFVHMVSANDGYYPEIVAHALKMLTRYPDAAMISGNARLWDAVAGKPAADMIVPLPQAEAFITPQEYAARNRVSPVIPCGGANTIRRETYHALGGQDPGLEWYADWFLYVLIGMTYGFAYVPAFYVTCRLEGEKSYSSGRFDWRRQKTVILRMLDLLRGRYPAQAELFRDAAILPRYSLGILLAVTARHRWFVTPLLVWRCIGHQGAFWLKAVAPRPLLMALRGILRL